MSTRMSARWLPAVTWVLAFFEQDTPQSMSRAVALLFALGGVAVAIIGAVREHEQPATVSALVIGGAVGLLSRRKDSGDPSDSDRHCQDSA